MSAPEPAPKRQLLTPSLFDGQDETPLRERVRTLNWDAEDLIVRQIELAGCTEREIGAVKIAVYDGGELVWGCRQRRRIEHLVDETIAEYQIEDATPFYLDFPLRPQPSAFKRYERFFAVVLLGPRLAIVERGPGGRYAVKPLDPGADKL